MISRSFTQVVARSSHKLFRVRRHIHKSNTLCDSADLAEAPRINQVGIQYLSNQLHKKVFPTTKVDDYLNPKHPELLETAKQHLQANDLLGKKTQITDPININHFPDMVGKTLDEHFYKLGQKSAEPYLSMAQNFLSPESSIPPIPSQDEWIMQSGWTRYTCEGEPEQVPYPLEDELVFDVEVLYKIKKFPIIATCASSKAWYGWVSPTLLDANNRWKKTIDYNHLIPMNCAKQPKLIIGYNVSYDRARILEEYNIKRSKAFYLDGMAMHVAISGICSRQRPMWQKFNKAQTKAELAEEEHEDDDGELVIHGEEEYDPAISIQEDPWLLSGSPNSLANVAKFHCGIEMNKNDREYFASEDPRVIVKNFNMLMDYCAHDVDATYTVTKKLFPEFFTKVPHPVSFAALKHLGSLILPTSTNWKKYIESAESCYEANRAEVYDTLKRLAFDLIKYIEQNDSKLKPEYESDPWLSQLNWDLKKGRFKKDGSPYKNNAYLTGYPEWYRELWGSISPAGSQMNLTLKSRITPLLLKLKWEGYPLFWTNSEGWCFKVPFDEEVFAYLFTKKYVRATLTEEEIDATHELLYEDGKSYVLFKIPHPDGPNKRCTSVLSKNYMRYFDDGTLTSEYDYTKKILKLNNEASYWMGNRNRIMDQFVVFNKEGKNKFFDTKKECQEHKDMGIIIPNLASMGTITRRATENTWLTASNSKKNRIGSELKSLIEAPEGYCFIGADVDSEELWIASLVGDSMFEIHGGSALGWMTLEGEKSQGTDLHSKTASILGISRNDAKVFNYGRIYGAGITFATRLLKQFNNELSDSEAEEIAKKLYASTKGMSQNPRSLGSKKMYYGGSESVMFNALEAIAHQPEPKTPVLGASITDALNAKNLKKNTYMTSRVNWTIQSSGVDYLHLLIISMEYLIEKYGLDARLAITVHDELRYLVKEKDKYLAALLLQISNLWTRAMFCEQLGIKEVPQSCAFFSEVDIDHVLRKEVGMDCVTPSHPDPIPPGESLDIKQLLEKTDNGDILNCNPKLMTLRTTKYEPRVPVMQTLRDGWTEQASNQLIRLQTSTNKEEWIQNLRQLNRVIKTYVTDEQKEILQKIHQDGINERSPVIVYRRDRKKRTSKQDDNKEAPDFDLEVKPSKENTQRKSRGGEKSAKGGTSKQASAKRGKRNTEGHIMGDTSATSRYEKSSVDAGFGSAVSGATYSQSIGNFEDTYDSSNDANHESRKFKEAVVASTAMHSQPAVASTRKNSYPFQQHHQATPHYNGPSVRPNSSRVGFANKMGYHTISAYIVHRQAHTPSAIHENAVRSSYRESISDQLMVDCDYKTCFVERFETRIRPRRRRVSYSGLRMAEKEELGRGEGMGIMAKSEWRMKRRQRNNLFQV
ncbi:MIP1 [Candida margitis]|uniref:MIP1 n=1 Tax=Candida margitis TaxID=1775924 RepID=UPI0022274D81|nr:MIP1 [Candida margitis]KAI5969821.1 MIP1 [Candida margitis]